MLFVENLNDLQKETIGMINEWFKESLPSVPKGDPSKEILTSERYLRPRLSFIKVNMRTYKVIHQKNNILSLRKTFEGFGSQSFRCADRSRGDGG